MRSRPGLTPSLRGPPSNAYRHNGVRRRPKEEPCEIRDDQALIWVLPWSLYLPPLSRASTRERELCRLLPSAVLPSQAPLSFACQQLTSTFLQTGASPRAPYGRQDCLD